MKSVSIIGVGRIGGAIAYALDAKGYSINCFATRNSKNAEIIAQEISSKPVNSTLSSITDFNDEIIFITTQDSEIENVVNQLVNKNFTKPTFIYHTSGSLSSGVFLKLKDKNCKLGSIHPLVSISDSKLGVKRFRDAYFCIEGDDEAINLAEKIVEDFEGKSFTIDSKYKSLYHASAVVACGHIVALIDASMEMLEECGLDAGRSKEILMPLIRSTINNLEDQNNSDALTGTFARADLNTFEQHLYMIKENMNADIMEIYLTLGERSLRLAKEQVIDAKRLEKMSKKLSLAKKNLKC